VGIKLTSAKVGGTVLNEPKTPYRNTLPDVNKLLIWLSFWHYYGTIIGTYLQGKSGEIAFPPRRIKFSEARAAFLATP
jgi:hypothetical protein